MIWLAARWLRTGRYVGTLSRCPIWERDLISFIRLEGVVRWLKSSIQSEAAPILISCFGSYLFVDGRRHQDCLTLCSGYHERSFDITENGRGVPGLIALRLSFSAVSKGAGGRGAG